MSTRPKMSFKMPVVLTATIAIEEVVMPQCTRIGGARFTVPPGQTTPIDKHPPTEIWLIGAGYGELSYDDRKLQIQSGDVIYLMSDAPHSIHNNGSQDLLIFSLWFLDESGKPRIVA